MKGNPFVFKDPSCTAL